MPYYFDKKGKKHHGHKKTMQSGTKSRVEIRAENEKDDDTYMQEYQEFLAELPADQRAAYQIQVVLAKWNECGQFGAFENEGEKQALLAKGLLPFRDPFTLIDGLVPVDAVRLHGRCVSRRGLLRALELSGDNAYAPLMWDNLRITLEDVQMLDLDPSEYRFFNIARRRFYPAAAVPFIAPAGDNDDDDNPEDDDEEEPEVEEEVLLVMPREMEDDLREERNVVYDDEQEFVTDILTNPRTSLEDFIAYINTEFEVPTHIEQEEVRYVPADPEDWPDTVEFDAHRIEGLLLTLVDEYYNTDEGRQYRRPAGRPFRGNRGGEFEDEFIAKIKYLLRDWRGPDDTGPYFYHSGEIATVLRIAVKENNLELVQEIEAFVTRMPIDREHERMLQHIPFERQINLPSIREEQQEVRRLLDRMRESAQRPGFIGREQHAILMRYGEFDRLVNRIHNLEALEVEHHRRRAAAIYNPV